MCIRDSYIRMARQSGWMPTFPTPTGDHHAMNGNHSAAVILDAWNKGIRGFDLEEAYRHLKHTVLNETKLPWIRGKATRLDRFYDENGYFPCLLYTSDAADDLLCVDLGGRLIIQKKKKQHHTCPHPH